MRPSPFATLALVAFASTACSGSKDEEGDPTPAEAPVPTGISAPEVVYGLPNIDNTDDWEAADPSDNDLVAFTITPGSEPAESIRLDVDGSNAARIWHDGAIVSENSDPGEIPWQADPIELLVEFEDFDVEAILEVGELDADGDFVSETSVRLRSSPLLLNHHMQPAELVVATEANFYGVGNGAFIQGYIDALGDRFESANGNRYPDPWMQDEIEFATGSTPDGQRMDLVIDSIRDRGLDNYPEDRFRGEQFGVETWGRGYASSQDSFGNLEVSPPVDDYPFGRIYYGDSGDYYGPQAKALFNLLDDVAIQEPFQIDISWLCVGHVDEFMTFVPDSTAPRGFRFVINDVPAAYEVLESMDPATPLPRWAGPQNHNYSTVGELVNDNGLRVHNEDIQADHLDPIREQMIAELGLLPDEVVLLPGLFEGVGYCYGANAAIMPGMANLIVTDFGEGTQLFIADPFLREDLGDQSTDPMIEAVTAIFPAEAELHFLDDWDVYHLGLGEVHCGSNVIRTPSPADWWTNDLGGSQ